MRAEAQLTNTEVSDSVEIETSSPSIAPQALIYLRVSTKEQAEAGGEREGFSIPAQREACLRKAEGLGAAVIEEFVDRGESAKSANRPELQRLLQMVNEQKIDFVIVHKVDRLARNRFDDVTINLALQQAGVTLVSVSENIDETPSGMLLHGIMSSIAEFYSRNLANEVLKGSVQKAASGGTPGKAPIGYLNVRRMENGREIRTVELDPERAPLMRWAFEQYAGGDWTLNSLAAALNERGLTHAPTPKRPARRVQRSHLNDMLRNPYYVGIISYRGVRYQGKHDSLIDAETFAQVETVLQAHDAVSGTKQRTHLHYLKGSLFCGECASRLSITNAKGNGGTYPYFFCLGRQAKRTTCGQRALSIEEVEAAVERHYATVQMKPELVQAVRKWVKGAMAIKRSETAVEVLRQNRKLALLKDERGKLLQAHYAGAIPIDLLKSEQDRIGREMDEAQRRLTACEVQFEAIESNLEMAVKLAGDCHRTYLQADATTRRLFNQAFFEKLLVDEKLEVTHELAMPFQGLLGSTVQKSAQRHARWERAQARPKTYCRQKARMEPEEALTVARGASYFDDGLSYAGLVETQGLEPWTPCLQSRCSSQLSYVPWH